MAGIHLSSKLGWWCHEELGAQAIVAVHLAGVAALGWASLYPLAVVNQELWLWWSAHDLLPRCINFTQQRAQCHLVRTLTPPIGSASRLQTSQIFNLCILLICSSTVIPSSFSLP
jgi:hypothetical protein